VHQGGVPARRSGKLAHPLHRRIGAQPVHVVGMARIFRCGASAVRQDQAIHLYFDFRAK
jgi:hypothetical protein